eukprot:1456104-Prymnesium_polylepis.1
MPPSPSPSSLKADSCGGRLAHRASPTACTTSRCRQQVSHRRARTARTWTHAPLRRRAACRARPARASLSQVARRHAHPALSGGGTHATMARRPGGCTDGPWR